MLIVVISLVSFKELFREPFRFSVEVPKNAEIPEKLELNSSSLK